MLAPSDGVFASSGQLELASFLDLAAAEARCWRQFLSDWEEEIYRHAGMLAKRIVANGTRNYPWLRDSADDLNQELLARVPYYAERYDRSKASWSKNLYHRFYFYLKDVLRKEDPVGIKWPQREQYPVWYRLGDGANRQGESAEFQGADWDGRNLEADRLNEDELLEAAAWASELDRLRAMAEDNRKNNCLPSMQDCGSGVCRSLKDPFWDKRKARVRFRSRATLRAWLKDRRRKRKLSAVEPPIPAEIPTEAPKPINTPDLMSALESAGRAGTNVAALVNTTSMTKGAIQAAVLRLRRDGTVYVVGQIGKKRDVYALAKFFPAGPPIPQAVRTKARKPKPKPKARPVAKKPPSPKQKIEQADIMLVVTALAGVRNQQLKSKLLAVLTESVGS